MQFNLYFSLYNKSLLAIIIDNINLVININKFNMFIVYFIALVSADIDYYFTQLILQINSASASVTMNVLTPTPKIVLSPTQQIQQMVTFVQGLATSGELDEGSSIKLTAIINAAETNLDRIENDPSVENQFAEPAELRYLSAR